MTNNSEDEKSIWEKIFSHYSWGHTWGIIGLIATFVTYQLSLNHTPEKENTPVDKPPQDINQGHINPPLQTKPNKHGKNPIVKREKYKNGSSEINKDVTTDNPYTGQYHQNNIGHKENKTINSNTNNNGFTGYGINAGRTVYSQQPINGDREQTKEFDPNNPIIPDAASRF